MASRDASHIHSIALVGHGASGKTTLMESVLFKSGAVNRKGSVNDGTSIGLIEDEEKERNITINCNPFQTEWNGHSIQLLDAPGYTDFIGAAVEALAAADVALVCISAVSGIEVNTRKAWHLAEERGIPRVIAITKMDGENADFEQVLSTVKEVFAPSAIPLFLPDASGPAFSSVISVVKPPEDNAEALALREELMESIVESDDELLERYLAEEPISDEEIGNAFSKAVSAGTVVPVIPCAADKDIGVQELLDAMTICFPSAADRSSAGQAQDEEEVVREPDSAAPFSAQVFKVMSDKFVGKLSFFRVLSGKLATHSPVYISRTRKSSKPGGLFRVEGAEQVPAEEVGPGEIGAISKVDDIQVSDTLCDANNVITYEAIKFPTPMVSLAIEPKARGDEQKISGAVASLTQEDPTFATRRDAQTHEMIISGTGTLHLDVMISRMKKRFNLEVNSKEPTIPYLETITAQSEASYRHKKQTGGRGQFGDVHIRMFPNERGEGFEFIDSIVGGAIPNQFIPAVEKGIRENMVNSCFAGFPAVDLKVELFFGSFHAVDSDEFSFKAAARGAYRDAFMKAKPVLLEPIVNLEVSIPSKYMGDITSDLNRRRGRITGMDSLGDIQIIKATVPLAEVSSYSTELRSMTGGEGDYSLEPSHFDIVPTHLAQQISAKAKKSDSEEEV